MYVGQEKCNFKTLGFISPNWNCIDLCFFSFFLDKIYFLISPCSVTNKSMSVSVLGILLVIQKHQFVFETSVKHAALLIGQNCLL